MVMCRPQESLTRPLAVNVSGVKMSPREKKNGNIGSGNFEYGHLFLSITEREASLLGSS